MSLQVLVCFRVGYHIIIDPLTEPFLEIFKTPILTQVLNALILSNTFLVVFLFHFAALVAYGTWYRLR